MIQFPLNENRFSFFFFIADHLVVQRARSEMRRCTTHALYWSKLWHQDHCQHPQNANPDGSTLEGTAQCIGRPFRRLQLWSLVWFQVRATSCYLTSSKSAWKSTLMCTWVCWRVWWSLGAILVQSVDRWQTLGVAAGLGAGSQVQRDPGLTSEGALRLFTLPSLAPSSPDLNPLDYFVWSYVENITNMTSHNTKATLVAAIRRVFAELPPALVEKTCSQFRIRIEAVNEAEGGYIE